jgi:hypothetical protein
MEQAMEFLLSEKGGGWGEKAKEAGTDANLK